MPIAVEIVDAGVDNRIFEKILDFFQYVDNAFSTYKENSEITKFNKGVISEENSSPDLKEVFKLCEKTKDETNGYFDIWREGKCDPSGLVKGWSIYKAAQTIKKEGFKNFYINAGGDIQVGGENNKGKKWTVGIENPLKKGEIVKIVGVSSEGVATSGTYIRGQHIYNPYNDNQEITEILSLTVIGLNILEADRFATAAFAMGRKGIEFIENRDGLEGYMIDKNGIAVYTSGFNNYVLNNAKPN